MKIYEALNLKLNKEMDEFRNSYKSMEPIQIYNDWYIISFYESYFDMLSTDYIVDKDIDMVVNWLSSFERPLRFLYEEWLSADGALSLDWDDMLDFVKQVYDEERTHELDDVLQQAETEKNSMNTCLNYLYRDGANYKVFQTCIINGQLSDEEKARIFACLDEGEYFIPSKVGLPEKKFDDYDSEIDHNWFEADINGFDGFFTETDLPAEVNITPKELLQAFEECSGRWEEAEVYKPRLDSVVKSCEEVSKTFDVEEQAIFLKREER